MEKAKTNLEEAYKLLNHISVSGENVMLLAAAMQAMKAAYGELERMEQEQQTEVTAG